MIKAKNHCKTHLFHAKSKKPLQNTAILHQKQKKPWEKQKKQKNQKNQTFSENDEALQFLSPCISFGSVFFLVF